MNINEIIRVVGGLNPTQKAELIMFIRAQTTANLDDAMQEIFEKLRDMGAIMNLGTDIADARQRIEAMRHLMRFL